MAWSGPPSPGHLAQFDMGLERPARGDMAAFSIGIRVVFDCHVVTEKDATKGPGDVLGDPAYWVDTGDNCRRFHVERYALSQSLPDLIRGLPDGKTKCYVAKNTTTWCGAPWTPAWRGPTTKCSSISTALPIPRRAW
ncbi:hypothetical protein D3C72_1707860 [compost metagenome]